MIVSEAVQAVRDLLLERTGDNGLADDTKLARAVNRGNRAVWKRAMAVKPDQWLWRSPSISYDLTDGLLFDAIAQSDSALAAELAQQFGQSDLASLDYVELLVGQQWWPLDPLNGGRERRIIEPVYTAPPGALVPPPYRWYIENAGIRLSPPPSSAVSCRVVWAPVLPEAGDDDSLLWGRYAQHHDTVVFKAAILTYASDEGQSTPWDREYKEAMELLVMDLEGGGQTMATRHVNPRSPFNA